MTDRDITVVLVGFGASSEEARQVYDRIEQRVRGFLPGCPVRWAFTSGRIAAKLRQAGVVMPTLEEVTAALKSDPGARAVIQPLLTVPGQEYAKMLELATDGGRFSVGEPLLAGNRCTAEVAEALAHSLEPDAVNVVVCHGNSHHEAYNAPLFELASAMEARYRNVVVASIEGSPGDAPLQRAWRMAQGSGWVHFVPFLLVAGMHVRHDVMGDHPGSWKSRAGGVRVTCAAPLGDNPAVQDLYLRRLEAAIGRLESRCH